MKKKVLVFLLLFLILLPSLAFAEFFEIDQYDIRMTVDENNNYVITETILVDFSSPRRGIFRVIPTRYYNYSHRIDILSVADEYGNPYEYTKEGGSDLTIKIGSPDQYVSGLKTYVIQYKYYGGDDRNTKFDQVYWNLIGTQWDVPIHKVNFSVQLPKGFNTDTLKITYGDYGSTDSLEWKQEGKSIYGTATGLRPHQALTFRLDLEEGYFKDVAKPYSLGEFLPMIGAMLAGVVGSMTLNAKNASNNRIIPVISFDPPDDLNPPELSYVFKEEIVSRDDIAALVLHWASKGYLKIEEQEAGIGRPRMVFHRLVQPEALEKSYEQDLFYSFFNYGDGNQVTINDLRNKFYQDITQATTGVRNQFRGEREILINSYQGLSMFLTLLVLAVAVFFMGGQITKLVGGEPIMGYIIAGVSLFIPLVIIIGNQLRRKKKSSGIFKFVIILLSAIAFSAAFLLFSGDFSLEKLADTWFLLILGVYVLSLILFTELVGLKKYTNYAQQTLGKVRGFEEFIRVAKTDELNTAFEQNKNYFYDILPYAYVLGLSDKWGEHIKSLSLPPPDWYSGTTFNPTVFHRTFSTGMSSASTAPVKSGSGGLTGGFGGGGFSGGGGGGGGGGSW